MNAWPDYIACFASCKFRVNCLLHYCKLECDEVIMIESVWCGKSGSLRKKENCLLLLRMLLKNQTGWSYCQTKLKLTLGMLKHLTLFTQQWSQYTQISLNNEQAVGCQWHVYPSIAFAPSLLLKFRPKVVLIFTVNSVGISTSLWLPVYKIEISWRKERVHRAWKAAWICWYCFVDT